MEKNHTLIESQFYSILLNEVRLTETLQKSFKSFDSWLWGLSEYAGPKNLINYVIPMMGAINMQLMGEMLVAVGLVNTLTSLIKWAYPNHRPYWWVHEYSVETVNIAQFPETCETSGGFPSSHCAAFTAFIYILMLHFNMYEQRRHIMLVLLSVPMWLSRVYMGSHFLHQCVAGTFFAILILDVIRARGPLNTNIGFLVELRRPRAVASVCFLVVYTIGLYLAMLFMGIDPHWPVRMAFKWCTNPGFLQHEKSPIFVLGRDLGLMMGIALSSPLMQKLKTRVHIRRRFAAVVVAVALNELGRRGTPKHLGRIVFILYEFTRNLIFSFSLLSLLPKLKQ